MQTNQLRKLTTEAVMAAVIFVVTWLVRVPVPVSGGAYLNLGDAAVFVCVFAAGGPAAAAAAAAGSGLADLAAGAPLYVLPTLLIKAAMAVAASGPMRRRSFWGYLTGCIAGGAVMTAGYGLFEWLLFDAAYALASLPFNLLQWAGSVLAAGALYEAARRLAGVVRGRSGGSAHSRTVS
ncbi:MAG: hypothetical protein HDQ87_06500 [Clostridia bacterium]|nr:hypothetical protein [Clostridia bacterium]